MSHILKAVGLKLVETLSIFLMCTADDRTAGLVADYSLNIFFVSFEFFFEFGLQHFCEGCLWCQFGSIQGVEVDRPLSLLTVWQHPTLKCRVVKGPGLLTDLFLSHLCHRCLFCECPLIEASYNCGLSAWMIARF